MYTRDTHQAVSLVNRNKTALRWRSIGSSHEQVAQFCNQVQVAQLWGCWIGTGRCRDADQAWPEHADWKRFMYMDIFSFSEP